MICVPESGDVIHLIRMRQKNLYPSDTVIIARNLGITNCRLPQFSRYLESSAFCIDNEPIPASEYEYMKHRETMKKKKLLKTYREYEKEDWFARKMKKKCVDHKSPRLDTFQRDKPYNRTNYVNSVYNRRDGLLYNDSDKQKNKKYDRKRLKRSLNRGKSIYIDLIPR